jgi:hypothetical protein
MVEKGMGLDSRRENMNGMERSAVDRKVVAPALAIGSRFKRFGPEEEKASRKAELKESEAVRQMKDAWRGCEYNDTKGPVGCYTAAFQIVEKLQYTAKDVEDFSIVLAEFQDEKEFSKKAGLFLSALINSGKDSDYKIFTNHLDVPPDLLGYDDYHSYKKNIIVKGNVGDGVGFNIYGGNITVEGDAGNGVGQEMRGGSILVKGAAGTSVGFFMESGEIKLEGDYVIMAFCIKGGRIYHKGELIWPLDQR